MHSCSPACCLDNKRDALPDSGFAGEPDFFGSGHAERTAKEVEVGCAKDNRFAINCGVAGNKRCGRAGFVSRFFNFMLVIREVQDILVDYVAGFRVFMERAGVEKRSM